MKSFRFMSGIIAIIVGLVILIYPIYSTRSFWAESDYLGSGLFQLPLILMYILAAGFSLTFIKEGAFVNYNFFGIFFSLSSGICFVRIYDIYLMMRYFVSNLLWYFVCSNIHLSKNLSTIS